MKILKIALLMILLACSVNSNSRELLTDDQIKQQIINQSIASYPSVCACPYSVARNGSRCGGRSAYSKAGGYSPLCYKTDVTDSMVSNFKRQNN